MNNQDRTTSVFVDYCHISMTEEEARIFYLMRQYQEIWQKAFSELRPGSLVLHFDINGKIKKHELHFYQK